MNKHDSGKSLPSNQGCVNCGSTNNENTNIEPLKEESILSETPVQDEYAPNSICFGCGPSNKDGLQLKSYRTRGGLQAVFKCDEKHQAFPGVINGGIIGSLIDCHGNWTAVTAQYEVKLKRPTPFGTKLKLNSRVLALQDDRAEVIIELKADGKTCATGRGLFVAVKEGHPAYHRWH